MSGARELTPWSPIADGFRLDIRDAADADTPMTTIGIYLRGEHLGDLCCPSWESQDVIGRFADTAQGGVLFTLDGEPVEVDDDDWSGHRPEQIIISRWGEVRRVGEFVVAAEETTT